MSQWNKLSVLGESGPVIYRSFYLPDNSAFSAVGAFQGVATGNTDILTLWFTHLFSNINSGSQEKLMVHEN